MDEWIALIGGQGKMPELTISELHAKKKKVFLLAIQGITSPLLVNKADACQWLYLTQIGKAIRHCKKRKIHQVIMAGRVPHKKIFSFSLLHMDWTTLRLLLKQKDRRADPLLSAVATELAAHQIELISSVAYLKPYLAPQGILTQVPMTPKMEKDISLGVRIAKQLGGLDIGQTVVIKDHAVVAVEAMEGTDQCIERAYQIAGTKTCIVKMAKPNQDMRFDVPVIGKKTIELAAQCQVACIAVEADKTLLLDEEIVFFAEQHGICLVALDPQKALQANFTFPSSTGS